MSSGPSPSCRPSSAFTYWYSREDSNLGLALFGLEVEVVVMQQAVRPRQQLGPLAPNRGFTETTIDDKTRKHTLALELARLDELQETFYARALEGDVACGALITKIIERRCTMLGLYTPQTATLQVIEAEAPRETSTERLRAAIDRIRGKTHQDDLPATDQEDPPSTH